MTTDTATKPTAWAHLPNAQHIDRALADVWARPQVWTAARVSAWDAARLAAWTAAWDAAWDAAQGAARAAARDAARDAIAALVAWDDCAYTLDMPPDACRVLASLGNHAAVLLLPAVLALNGVQS